MTAITISSDLFISRCDNGRVTAAELLADNSHRPWALPARPWLIRQQWNHLLFAHWAIDPRLLRSIVPDVLELDVREGRCWVAVTPFFLSGLTFRNFPPVPGTTSFPELNVRTYVRYRGRPGVFFFSLDAGSAAAVFGARAMYGLPYFYAHMRLRIDDSVQSVRYDCLRRHPRKRALFHGEYRPCGPVFRAAHGSLEQFLVERYCLYSVLGRRLYRADIHHSPWPLRPATADILVNTMASVAGVRIPQEAPLLHYAQSLDVLVWGPERLL